MVFVTDLSAHCAHTYPIHHLTSVTVVPSERKKSHKTNVYHLCTIVNNKASWEYSLDLY